LTITSAAADPETVDHRDPEARLRALFDRGTLRLLQPRDDSGMLSGRGEIDGVPAIAYASDGTKMGGAMGDEGCRHVVDAIDSAVRERVPVIGLWHSGGARLAEGVVALDAVGQVFAAMVRASGRVPQISVVLGPAAGGAAYGPALTDIVIMSGAGRIFVTGPEVVRSVTGEQVDMERLGGPEPHGRRSGVVHVTTKDDESALETARKLAALLGRQGRVSPADVVDVDLGSLLPVETNRAYDVKPVVNGLLDAPGLELHAKWAPNVVTTLGRFGGRTVGVIANNPLRLGGCLDAASAEKAARFVRMCDALGVPLIVVVDVWLFRTRWGLRTRAVGEHPKAADTVGINVLAMRYRNVIIGGAIAGIGGAYFTFQVGQFQKNITSGYGFIALAAVIFGRWSPRGAVGAALLFGFATAMQTTLSINVPSIPSDVIAMLPYLATIFAVAGLVGKVRAPAADGEPYVKE